MQGGIFSDDLDNGRATATLRVSGGRIEATTADGHYFAIESAACELELGGASGRMWFVRTVDRTLTLFSEDPGMAEALAGDRRLRERVEALRAADGRARTRQGLLTVALTALAAVALWGAYLGLLALGRSSVEALPMSVDQKLGELAVEQMDLGGPVLDDPEVGAAVTAIVDRLAAHAGAEDVHFHVQVVDSETVNAFALPGGEIVVYTGLLRQAETAEQVAGVLGHEMAHVTLRHGMTRLAHTMGLTAALQLLLGDVAGLSGLVLELARSGALTSHGRDQERAADARGVQTLAAAGIDPIALSTFFGEMARARGDDAVQLPAWLASHPAHGERQRTIAAMAAKLAPLTLRPLPLDWPAVQRALGPGSASGRATAVAVAADAGTPAPDAGLPNAAHLNPGPPAGDDGAPTPPETDGH